MKDREKYRNMDIYYRKELIEKLFINHPSFERCFNKIKECHEHSKISVEPLCCLITGEPGVGKTTLCTKYEEAHPRVELNEKTRIPVLVSRIPIPTTTKNMVTALLKSIDDPLADKGTAYTKTTRLFDFIEKCEVEMLILDEFHHVIDRDSNRVIYEVSDWLKQLINETKIPIALVGLPHSIRILEANDQLNRRFALKDRLVNFEWIDKKKDKGSNNDNDFRYFLKAVDKSLPLAEHSNLAGSLVAYRMWKATQGNVNRTMKIIRYAARLTLEAGQEKITLEFLKIAYEKMFGSEDQDNPFTD